MADKPGHVLEISNALGRDVDKLKAGKKIDLPVEAFMSDAALEQVARQTRESKEAVHAEQLVPISKAEAARRRTQTGETLPNMPATRRVIPPPFRRPRIEAGSHGKTWQYVAATGVAAGDIVPDVGLVVDMQEQVVYSTRGEILGAGFEGDLELPTTVSGKVIDAAGLPVLNPDEKVAVGIAYVVIGDGGNVKAFRDTDQVRVFRKP